MKRKTIIHRIVDSDKFDSDIEKFEAKVEEEGMSVDSVQIACGQNHLIAHIMYSKKAARGTKRTSKA